MNEWKPEDMVSDLPVLFVSNKPQIHWDHYFFRDGIRRKPFLAITVRCNVSDQALHRSS